MPRMLEKQELSLKMSQVPIKKIDVKVNLKITRLFRIRLWIGLELLWLLSHVWGCDIDVDYVDDPSRLVEVKR